MYNRNRQNFQNKNVLKNETIAIKVQNTRSIEHVLLELQSIRSDRFNIVE